MGGERKNEARATRTTQQSPMRECDWSKSTTTSTAVTAVVVLPLLRIRCDVLCRARLYSVRWIMRLSLCYRTSSSAITRPRNCAEHSTDVLLCEYFFIKQEKLLLVAIDYYRDFTSQIKFLDAIITTQELLAVLERHEIIFREIIARRPRG